MKYVGTVTPAEDRFYPGSAPLDRGKDLLPASLLLLCVYLDYKDPAPTTQEPATSLSVVRVSLSGTWLRTSLLGLINPRSRTLLIKVAGPWTYNLYRVLLTRSPTLGFILPN